MFIGNRLSDGRTQFFVAYIQDRLFTGERQIMIINTYMILVD